MLMSYLRCIDDFAELITNLYDIEIIRLKYTVQSLSLQWRMVV